MRAALDWLDGRTGWRGLLRGLLDESIPGGARWRYACGSALAFAFAVQCVTGIVLWMAYSPSSQTAWESVYYIQFKMQGGWFLRGLHHFMAQAAVVLLALHLGQVVLAGAYRAPREVNFWLGLVLMQLLLALCMTGYLLPWDQKGYWATKVATNLMGIVPGAGPVLQRLAMGGADYGHHTLSRFFALHAGILPALLILVLAAHVYVFRRHGVTVAPRHRQATAARFWPDQALRDAVACLAVLLAVVALAVARGGAPLGAPADPAIGYPAARPEWYFLSLFQLMKQFPGKLELVGGLVIPGAVLGLLLALPWLGRRERGHRLAATLVILVIVAVGSLIAQALRADARDPDYLVAVKEAEESARRVAELAEANGIPAGGAAELLRHDPLSQGPRLFAQHCAKCHRFGGHDGLGRHEAKEPRASDLRGFASFEWLAGLLDKRRIGGREYYGGTSFKDGSMVEYVTECPLSEQQLQQTAAALSAQARLPAQAEAEERLRDDISAGVVWLKDERAGCAKCHRFQDAGIANWDRSPDLTDYGTREWIAGMITNPRHQRYYGQENDGMPAFGTERLLTPAEIGVLADWLRNDWVPTRIAAVSGSH